MTATGYKNDKNAALNIETHSCGINNEEIYNFIMINKLKRATNQSYIKISRFNYYLIHIAIITVRRQNCMTLFSTTYFFCFR